MKSVKNTLTMLLSIALIGGMASCAGEADKTTKKVADTAENAANDAADAAKKAADEAAKTAADAKNAATDEMDKMDANGVNLDFAEGSWAFGVNKYINDGGGSQTFDLDKITEDKGDLSPEGDQQLTELAAMLKAHPELTAEIQAHTPKAKMATGAAAKKAASEARAQWVKLKLKLKGVDGDQLTAKGYGGSEPKAGMDEMDDAQRRLAVMFSQK